jgi:anthranilate phosphoribosyltransferase
MSAPSSPAPPPSPAGSERLRAALARVLSNASLSRAEARGAMEAILAGEATPAQIGGLLAGLRLKGETADEIAGFVEAMRAAAVPVAPGRRDLIDLCGTGGDGAGTINISTAAALIAAAAGAGVAKHGNRSASSRCGSADVLESMGLRLDLTPQESAAQIDALGFAFLFAPSHHPAMRHAGGPRRELGTRTVFNILGPLSNPAGVRRQLIGVFDDGVRARMVEVLQALGSERVWVVHARVEAGGREQGLDEISICGPTRVTALDRGRIEDFEVVPEDAGLARAPLESLRGGDAAANARALEAVFAGERGPHRDAALLNAGAALVIAGLAAALREGVERAAAAVDAGKVRRLVEELRRWR